MSNDPDTPVLDDVVEENQIQDQDPASGSVPKTQEALEPVRSVEHRIESRDDGVEETKLSMTMAQAEELANLRKKTSELEASYQSAIRERELAKALAGCSLVPGAVAQLIKLWNSDFDVIQEAGAYKVVSRDGRSVREAMTDWLSQPEYAHFCRPSSRGGTSVPGTNRSLADATAPTRPLSLGEAVLQRWRESSASRPDSASLPNGFGRNR